MLWPMEMVVYQMEDEIDMQVILGAALGAVLGLMVAALLWVAKRNPKAIARVALIFMRRPSKSCVSPYGECKSLPFRAYNCLQAQKSS